MFGGYEMGANDETKVIEINKPNRKQVQNRLGELAIFLSKNWEQKHHKKEQKG